MNVSISYTSCAVFEGRIVVSGGYNNGFLSTVEAYDHIAEKWTNMLNIVEETYHHKSVAFKNKLFIVGEIQQLVKFMTQIVVSLVY